MESNRYYGRNGKPCSMDKETLRSVVDPLQPRTFIKFLEEMDIPFIEDEWIYALQSVLNRKGDSKYVIGRYIALMNLKGFRSFTFADSRYDKNVIKYKVIVEKELPKEAQHEI